MKQPLLIHFRLLMWAVLLLGSIPLTAQVLNKPVPAPNQTPPAGSTAWNRACASASFNDYWVNFTWSPPLVNSGNEFILELSDASGNFSSPVELARDGSKNTVFDFFFQFSIPTDTRGENYKFRVRSTSPANLSPASDPFPMYYISINSGLTIRPQGQADFGDGTAQVCDGSSITLEVYNLSNASTYQYNWYRSGTPLAEKSNKITVTQAGMYNVEIDYGACSGSGNTLSNLIDITTGTSLGIGIDPPVKTDLCSGDTVDLEANIGGAGLNYIWYKDGAAITLPTIDDDTYTVDASSPGFEGDYQVEIFGTGICLERSPALTITSAGGFTVTRANPANMVILPSQNITLSVSTTAATPMYQWYKNSAAVAGATNSTLVLSNVSDAGTYYAEVSDNAGTCPSVVASTITTVIAPASFEIIVDYATPYVACESTSIVLEIIQINAVDSGGGKTDVTSGLLPFFAYQWKKDGVAVAGATSNTISLTGVSENGAYTLDAVLDSYNVTTAARNVQLLVNETLVINSTSLISCGASEPVTISTGTDLTAETYQWLRDGADQGLSGNVVEVTQPGIYQLVLQRNGCPLKSNEITLAPLDESLITLDPSGTVIFPEGSSRTVNASGADTYRWYDSSNSEISNGASNTFTAEGTYLLIATVGNCEVTKTINVEYLETFRVPNVISVNGDGINDQWILPNSYSNKSDVRVTIYNAQGEEIFNQTNYQNNWPESTRVFARQNMVFYYKIRNANEVLKQGTITVIR